LRLGKSLLVQAGRIHVAQRNSWLDSERALHTFGRHIAADGVLNAFNPVRRFLVGERLDQVLGLGEL
jgi:hypothetical protein